MTPQGQFMPCLIELFTHGVESLVTPWKRVPCVNQTSRLGLDIPSTFRTWVSGVAPNLRTGFCNERYYTATLFRRDTRPSYSNSYAMEAATSQHTCYYRSGYDISIGHFPKVVFPGLEATPPNDRKYFLTFRVGFASLQDVSG